MEEIEQGQSDALEQVSSEPASAPASENESAPAKAAEGSQTTKEEPSKEDLGPFHKHPRWIERENELKAERQARAELQREFQQMQQQLQKLNTPQQPDKRQAYIERLKKEADPEFAEFVSGLASTKELEELRTWRAQQEQQAVRQQARTEIERLHTQHKVDEQSKARYSLAIEAKIRANPQLRLEDLPAVYKEVHDDFSAWTDAIKRAERESYVKAKQAQSAAPTSQPRGTPVKQTGKAPEWSKNKDEARQQLIKRVLDKANAQSDI